jgi:CHAD domain-containing protein
MQQGKTRDADWLQKRLAEIETYRASLPPEERARIEADELAAQRESWIRAMAPCEHGDPDWETCPHCLAQTPSLENPPC